MKILIIHTCYKLRGGEDSVVENETALLRSQGHEVELLQFSNAGSDLLKLVQLPFNYSSYKKTRAVIQAFRPVVVHIHNLHFAGSASPVYAAAHEKVPVVMTLHNYRLLCPSATLYTGGRIFMEPAYLSFSWQAVWKGAYLNSKILTFWVSCSMLLHQLLGTWRIPAAYIALGDYTCEIFSRSSLASLCPRIVVKPNFCYALVTGTFVAKTLNDSYYLYIGRLSDEKGVRVLLNAFAGNGLPLRIAGTGLLETLVQEYTQAYPNIKFLGSVDKAKVASLLAGASALIFPSLWYETFGMVIIEAFSQGVPVFASDIGQMKVSITNGYNGFHFKAGDAADLGTQVEAFEKLPSAERTVIGLNARDTWLQLYSPEKNAEMLLRIYEGAVRGNAVS